jgi:hypothetical protein
MPGMSSLKAGSRFLSESPLQNQTPTHIFISRVTELLMTAGSARPPSLLAPPSRPTPRQQYGPRKSRINFLASRQRRRPPLVESSSTLVVGERVRETRGGGVGGESVSNKTFSRGRTPGLFSAARAPRERS